MLRDPDPPDITNTVRIQIHITNTVRIRIQDSQQNQCGTGSTNLRSSLI